MGADSTTLAAAGRNIAPNAASAYQSRAAGARPAAGVNSAGTVLSAYCFPRSLAGTSAPQDTVSFNRAVVLYFVDRVPGGS